MDTFLKFNGNIMPYIRYKSKYDIENMSMKMTETNQDGYVPQICLSESKQIKPIVVSNIYAALTASRVKSGQTQRDVAQKMHTSVSAIGRLETSGAKSNPTLATLNKYAEALGLELQIKLVKIRKPQSK